MAYLASFNICQFIALAVIYLVIYFVHLLTDNVIQSIKLHWCILCASSEWRTWRCCRWLSLFKKQSCFHLRAMFLCLYVELNFYKVWQNHIDCTFGSKFGQQLGIFMQCRSLNWKFSTVVLTIIKTLVCKLNNYHKDEL